MVELSSLSNEELLQLEQQTTGGGQQDLSSLSDKELLSLEQQTSQPDVLTQDFPDAQKSPLSFMERMRLSFADDAGREAFLKKKFQIVERLPNGKFGAGDDPNSVLPIDPEGMFNDVIGDLADVAAEIPTIAGQIIGSVAGIPGGPAGVIAGGAVGAGAGRASALATGTALGVREAKALEDATDIAITSAFGAAGEGLAIGTQIVGRSFKGIIAKKLLKAADKAVKTDSFGVPLPQDAAPKVKLMSKLLKFLANVPEESTETAYKHGIEKTLGNPQNLKKTGVIRIVNQTVKALEEVNERLGKEVGKQVRLLEKAARISGKTSRIQVDDLFPVLKREAQALGLLDDFGRLNKNLPFEARDIKPITALLKEFGDLSEGRYIAKAGKTIQIRRALQITRSFGNKFEKLTPQGQRILGESLDAFRGKITAMANDLGVPDFARANQNYSNLLKLKGQLKQLDPNNLQGMERFVKGLENHGEFTKQSLADLQKISKVQFLDDMEMWNAAQDFVSANPNMLRFGMIAGTLGVTTGLDSKESLAITLGGALLLGTPAGSRQVLRALAKVGGIPRSATGTARKTLDTKATSAILSRLLQSEAFNSGRATPQEGK